MNLFYRFKKITMKKPINDLLYLIEKYPYKEWNWVLLSRNPIVTPEFVEKFIDKPWDWSRWGLSLNLSITPEFVEKFIDKPIHQP
jgi:hypothetical protein